MHAALAHDRCPIHNGSSLLGAHGAARSLLEKSRREVETSGRIPGQEGPRASTPSSPGPCVGPGGISAAPTPARPLPAPLLLRASRHSRHGTRNKPALRLCCPCPCPCPAARPRLGRKRQLLHQRPTSPAAPISTRYRPVNGVTINTAGVTAQVTHRSLPVARSPGGVGGVCSHQLPWLFPPCEMRMNVPAPAQRPRSARGEQDLGWAADRELRRRCCPGSPDGTELGDPAADVPRGKGPLETWTRSRGG